MDFITSANDSLVLTSVTSRFQTHICHQKLPSNILVCVANSSQTIPLANTSSSGTNGFQVPAIPKLLPRHTLILYISKVVSAVQIIRNFCVKFREAERPVRHLCPKRYPSIPIQQATSAANHRTRQQMPPIATHAGDTLKKILFMTMEMY